MTRRFTSIIAVLIAVMGTVSAEKWLTYERCELADDKYFDGDSFSVKALTGYTYVFRLYGVDCPETDKRVKSRLVEQAKEFNIEEKDVIKWGKKAADFSKKFLRKPFTVYTRKTKAGGASKKARYFAIVVNAEGKRLDEALVEAGLARAYGMGAEWDEPFWHKTINDLPSRMTSKRFISKLHSLESKAKRDKAGVWKK
ncbi:MAG: thermonuclease family protein [Akkermansiaceae bacterium]|nr:thermonuclease family protein [Akkermansiaceae bacterium]